MLRLKVRFRFLRSLTLRHPFFGRCVPLALEVCTVGQEIRVVPGTTSRDRFSLQIS